MKALILLLFLSASALGQQQVKVAQILDGDTFLDTNGHQISIYGVSTLDTPEARTFLKICILDRIVKLYSVRRDLAGNFVAYVNWGDWDVGATLVQRGYAKVAVVGHSTYTQYEDEARREGKGIWQGQLRGLISETSSLFGVLPTATVSSLVDSSLTPTSLPTPPRKVTYARPAAANVQPVRRSRTVFGILGGRFRGAGGACVGGN